MDTQIEPEAFLSQVEAQGGAVLSVRSWNLSGLLWEQLWRHRDGRFESVIRASGVFDNWHTYGTREDARHGLSRTLEARNTGE